MNYGTSLSFLIAIAIPLLLIFVRNRIRLRRDSLVHEIGEKLNLGPNRSASFEFAKGKYAEESTNWSAVLTLLVSSVPFMVVSFLGLQAIFISLPTGGAVPRDLEWLATNILLSGENGAGGSFREALTVLASVFAGAILFAGTYLVRAVTNYELSPLSFLRVTLHILMALVTVTLLWRAGAVFTGAENSTLDVKGAWFLAAFLIGFFPDLGLRFILSRVHVFVKAYRTDLTRSTHGVPLDVIDGIDAWGRFRLEEAMICDVQNLATANPLLLHVETPYGLYECIDWVAQAQLCTIVGADCFIELRRRHIRTIFDLERVTLGDGATPALRRAISELVLRVRRPPGEEGKDSDQKWPSTPLGDEELKQLFSAMIDDLHVHRLRQIWMLVGEAIGPEYAQLSPARVVAQPAE